MKGILLAGGLGTRLSPLTDTENKHLLPIYNRRMIEFPIGSFVEAGIKDIVLITGGKHPGQFLEFIKNGYDFGIKRLYYTYQEGNGGIVEALLLASSFMESTDDCIVILGDNYFELSLRNILDEWRKNPIGAKIVLSEVDTPKRFGIAEVDNTTKKILSIEEKPTNPKGNLAITGCFLFDKFVWDFCRQVKNSDRGEKEITDVLSIYNQLNLLSYCIYNGYWGDMGVFETLLEVANKIALKDRGF